MDQGRHHFVILTSTEESHRHQRDKELEDSNVRSHAARVSHRRRAAAKSINPSIALGLVHRACQCRSPSICHSCNVPLRGHGHLHPQQIGGQDPFATYAGHNTPIICHKALEYAREIAFFPHFAPLRLRQSEITSLVMFWRQAAVHHPFLFHAEIVCSLGWVIRGIEQPGNRLAREVKVIQAQQRGLALQLLRKEFENPAFQLNDAHIHAIAGLAVSSEPPLAYTEPYPSSPMGDLQKIHALSSFKITLPHLEALYRCVSMRGGIKAIKLHALAEVLQMDDIAISTALGKAPRFPLLQSTRCHHRALTKSAPECGQFSQGFAIQGVSSELYDILYQMCYLTHLVDRYHHQFPSRRSTSLTKTLVEGRNEAQHRLLSFCPGQCLDSTSESSTRDGEHGVPGDYTEGLEELVRLAAMVYSDMVLFPLAWVSGVKHQLAKRMHTVAQTSQLYHSLIEPEAQAAAVRGQTSRFAHADLHVWILWFGCFAAIRSDLQPWFEENLGRMLELVYGDRVRSNSDAGCVRFEEARAALRSFLWWGPVCDEPGRALWGRVIGRLKEREDEDEDSCTSGERLM